MSTNNTQPKEQKSTDPKFDSACCRGHLEGDAYDKRRIRVVEMLQWFYVQGKTDIELHYYFTKLNELKSSSQVCEILAILEEKGFLQINWKEFYEELKKNVKKEGYRP